MKIKYLKQILIIIFATFLLAVVMSPLRAIGFKVSSLIAPFIYFGVYQFYVKKFGDRMSLEKILFAMLLGAFGLDASLRFYDYFIISYTGSLISLLDVIVHFIAVILAYLYCKLKGKKRIAPLVLTICIPVFVYFEGYDMYLHYYNYHSLSGRVEMAVSFPDNLETINGKQETLPEDCRYVLLYFWSEYCGFCIDKFPELQGLYDNCPPHCRFYSVYCGTEERWKQVASQYIEGFSFPVLLFTKDWGIEEPHAFPDVYVLDLQKSQAIYFGNLKYGRRLLKSLL